MGAVVDFLAVCGMVWSVVRNYSVRAEPSGTNLEFYQQLYIHISLVIAINDRSKLR